MTTISSTYSSYPPSTVSSVFAPPPSDNTPDTPPSAVAAAASTPALAEVDQSTSPTASVYNAVALASTSTIRGTSVDTSA